MQKDTSEFILEKNPLPAPCATQDLAVKTFCQNIFVVYTDLRKSVGFFLANKKKVYKILFFVVCCGGFLHKKNLWNQHIVKKSICSLQTVVVDKGHSTTSFSGIQLDVNQFACPICPKTMKTKSDMSRHILTHTGDKPFSCTICNQSFNRKSSRDRHMEKMHGMKIEIPL